MSKCAGGVRLSRPEPCPECGAGPNGTCARDYRNMIRGFDLLEQLVDALDKTSWSSWQTTAPFSRQLDQARDHVQHVRSLG